MVMLPTTLGSELENMEPTDQEATAINNFADAWETYFYDAAVGVIPANPGSLTAATTAMKAALIGMSADSAGANKIQSGIIAFWGVVATAAPTIWTTVPPCTGATPPPTLSAIGAALQAAFAANTAAKNELPVAALAAANAIHPSNLGGICVIPSPGAPTPIT